MGGNARSWVWRCEMGRVHWHPFGHWLHDVAHLQGFDNSVQSVSSYIRCDVERVSCCSDFFFSPLTRYLQMSGMLAGAMIEADHSMRQYEAHVRMQRRLARDRAAWQQFEAEYGKDDDE